MITVGLTGNAASGKSAVAEVWRAAGVPVVSADELAREAVRPGSPGLESVREAFGHDVIGSDGSLDRARLGEVVFGDDEARARLEAIVHPVVWRLRDAWTAARRAEGHPLVAAEIPLLFETGRESDFDRVVFVDAPDDVRLRRLVGDRGLPERRARALMAAQAPAADKRPRADHVIDNVGTLAELEAAASVVLGRLLEGAGSEGHPAEPLRLRLDLHLHTWGSWDCLSDPEAVLLRARQRGVGRIAITDHDRLTVARQMADEYPDRVIAGEEVRTAEGIDVIGLYLTEVIPRGTPARETCERIRAQGGVVYLPHPFARGKGGSGRFAEELAPLVDVVEVFNARLHPGHLNGPATGLAERHDRLRGAGSDAHTVGEVAGAWVETPWHENRPHALLAALRQGHTAGRTSSNLVHLASTWAKVRRRVFGLPEGAPAPDPEGA